MGKKPAIAGANESVVIRAAVVEAIVAVYRKIAARYCGLAVNCNQRIGDMMANKSEFRISRS